MNEKNFNERERQLRELTKELELCNKQDVADRAVRDAVERLEQILGVTYRGKSLIKKESNYAV